MMKNKKAALQLSVNAVVVIIIAIVMLGLALTFIRSIFGGMIEQFEQVSEEVRKQMEDTLRATTRKAALSTNSLDMKAGDRKTIYLGINNYLTEPVDFCIASPNSKHGLTWCGGDTSEMECVGYEVTTLECEDAVVLSSPMTKTVLNGKIDVIPIKVEVKSNAKADTYLIPINVYGQDPTDPDSKIEEVIDLYVNVG
jgi:hypothetical protein